MKKTILLLLSIVCVCCFMFAMTACNQENKPTDSSNIQSDTTNSENSTNQGQEPNSSSQGQTPNSSEGQAPNSSSAGGGSDVPPAEKHEHNYGEWVYDETNHWKECTANEGECDAPKIDIAKHTIDSESGICKVCQFQQGVTLSYSEIKENDKVVGYSVTGVTPKNVTSVSIPDKYNGKPITTIGLSAFYDLDSLTSVTIGNNVTYIGNYAFGYCKNLTSITIPASVTSFGYEVFEYCSSLNRVNIENLSAWCKIDFDDNTSNPLYFAKNLYLNGEPLTNLVIPSNITSIKQYTFNNCESLTSVTIPDGVTSIAERAFGDCKNLANIKIGKNVKSIGEYAFYECNSLKDVTMGNGIASIGNLAFSGCPIETATVPTIAIKAIKNKNLKTVNITSGDSIGDYAFNGCSKLTNVTIADSVKSIGSSVFTYCPIETATVPSFAISAIRNDKLKTVNIISGEAIEEYAFQDCASLVSITFPDSVTSIGFGAFNGCFSLKYNEYDNALYLSNKDNPYFCLIKAKNTSITSCDINSNTKFIYSNAFARCEKLTSVTIDNGVLYIGDYAFYRCLSLTSITIPDSVTSIASHAFSNCTGLTTVTIGNGLTSIGEYAFSDCKDINKIGIDSLSAWCKIKFNDSFSNPLNYAKKLYLKDELVTDLVIPEDITSIGDYAFYCASLTSVTIPNGVTSIGTRAFYGCTGLTNLTIPNSVTSIGETAFDHCGNLTSIKMGNGVTSIGDYAFNSCLRLTGVYITDLSAWCKIKFTTEESNPLYYAKNLYLNDKLVTDLVIPDGITSIGDYAFYNCTSLTSVTLSNSVTSIGTWAFYSCTGLTSLTIPSSVTSIDSWAFYNCTSLTSVTFQGTANWTVTDESMSEQSVTVTDPSTNAKNLTINYCSYIWKRLQ